MADDTTACGKCGYGPVSWATEACPQCQSRKWWQRGKRCKRCAEPVPTSKVARIERCTVFTALHYGAPFHEACALAAVAIPDGLRCPDCSLAVSAHFTAAEVLAIINGESGPPPCPRCRRPDILGLAHAGEPLGRDAAVGRLLVMATVAAAVVLILWLVYEELNHIAGAFVGR